MGPTKKLKDPGLTDMDSLKKRKYASSNNTRKWGNNGRSKKRVKVEEARIIRTQLSDEAFHNGGLDLQSFMNARKHEIESLEVSLRACKSALATRAFQSLPRSMRRRTASHNVKRVPKRLRNRHRREMVDDGAKPPTRRPRTTRSRIRAETAKRLRLLEKKEKKREKEEWDGRVSDQKNGSVGSELKKSKPKTIQSRPAKPKTRTKALNVLSKPPKQMSRFRKRQIEKTWLPTHLWHAKRAKMTGPNETLWRFAIPLEPSEKCYRSTHRASSQKGCVAWEVSYMSTIGLYGTAGSIQVALRRLGLTQENLWGNRGGKWRAGSRAWNGPLSKERKAGRRVIGPATIIWNPEKPSEAAEDPGSAPRKKCQRQIFIRVHPSCFLELFHELLKLTKMTKPRLSVEDLRYAIGSIELTGPASTEALLGILHPYNGKDKKLAEVFRSLVGVTNPSSLPKDSLLAFSILDPRLRYPPTKLHVNGAKPSSLSNTLVEWPGDHDPELGGLFDSEIRSRASCIQSQKSIDRRKSETLPSELVELTDNDPPIPILLVASQSRAGASAQGTWTLLAPWKCISPIWRSLMQVPLLWGGTPRFGGLKEQMQVAFEHGVPWFPGDFPGTDAGVKWELEQRAKRKRDWERRPKSKRIAWESLNLGAQRTGEVGDGLACDFEILFGLPIPGTTPTDDTASDGVAGVGVASHQADETESRRNGRAKPVYKAISHSLATLDQLSKATWDKIAAIKTERSPPRSLVTVRLNLLTRGTVRGCARIYRLSTKSRHATEHGTQDVIPATEPLQPLILKPGLLLRDTREQWLGKLADAKSKPRERSHRSGIAGPTSTLKSGKKTGQIRLARSIADPEVLAPSCPMSNQFDIGGHLLCPDVEDLIGFVTTGAFNLIEGKSTAIGSVSTEKALETLRQHGQKEGRLCVVRNAGENVGWLARWKVV